MIASYPMNDNMNGVTYIIWNFTSLVIMKQANYGWVLKILSALNAFQLTNSLSIASLLEEAKRFPHYKAWVEAFA